MYDTDDMPPPGVPNNLEAYWMPFTANRQFKSNPRLLVAWQAADRRGGAAPGRPHGLRAVLPDGPPDRL